MRTSTILSTLGAAAVAVAQRPNGTTICDYYSNALFNSTNGTTEYALLTALVNTAVIGNYSAGAKVAVTGILNKGTYNGTDVNLLPYFDGMLASSNRGGSAGVSVNFLDGGGADPLKMNMPANGTSSNQYFLLTHLYEYFGALLGCSSYNKTGFPGYSGDTSMYEVHKFMDLDAYEVGYFITQVGYAAASFGVAPSDIEYVAGALNKLFNYKCSPPTSVLPNEKPELQAICIASSCPEAPTPSCSLYAAAVMPASGNSSNMYTSKPTASSTGSAMGGAAGGSSASSTSGSSGSQSSSAGASSSTGGAIAQRVGAGAGVLGLAALAFAL